MTIAKSLIGAEGERGGWRRLSGSEEAGGD